MPAKNAGIAREHMSVTNIGISSLAFVSGAAAAAKPCPPHLDNPGVAGTHTRSGWTTE